MQQNTAKLELLVRVPAYGRPFSLNILSYTVLNILPAQKHEPLVHRTDDLINDLVIQQSG